MSKPVRYIPILEFRERGYLHEVNRRFLHPLGLALEVVVETDGTERLGGIWDERDDPGGIAFAELDPAKIAAVDAEIEARQPGRITELGYWIQE